MFPHYMEVAGWLALAAFTLAWISLAVYLTRHLATQSTATSSTRGGWIVALWLAPGVGVAVYLIVTARARRSAGASEAAGDGRPQLR